MYSRKSIIAVTMVFGLLMVIFSFTDLMISKALFNMDSLFGRFFEAFGEMTAVIVGLLSFSIIFFTIKSTVFKGDFFKVLTFIMIILSRFMTTFMPLHYVMENFIGWAIGLMIIFVGVALFITSKVSHLPSERKNAFRQVANVGASLFFLAIAIINIIKPIWGRVRFREMYEPYDMFTAWFVPQLGNYRPLFEDPASFPSGHTANAAVILMIVLLPMLFDRCKGKEKILYTISIAWIALVALSRIVMGAHFGTD